MADDESHQVVCSDASDTVDKRPWNRQSTTLKELLGERPAGGGFQIPLEINGL